MSGLSVVQKRAFASAFAAVALHMLILGLWVMVIIIDLPIFAFQPPELEPQAEPEMTVVMIPFVKKQAPMIQKRPQEEPPEKVEQKPEPEQQAAASCERRPLMKKRLSLSQSSALLAHPLIRKAHLMPILIFSASVIPVPHLNYQPHQGLSLIPLHRMVPRHFIRGM